MFMKWTVPDIAQRYDVSIQTVYRWVRHQHIPFVRLGPRVLRFSEIDIKKWEHDCKKAVRSDEQRGSGVGAARGNSRARPRGRPRKGPQAFVAAREGPAKSIFELDESP